MHKHLVKHLMETNTIETKQFTEYLLLEMLEDIKREDCIKYLHIKREMYEHVHGNHLCEKLAREWVDEMKNEDGTIGGHWTIDATEANNPKHHNKWDWYATLNMMYSDYYNPKFNTDDYIHLAHQFLSDKDAPDDKLLEYYFHIIDKE